MVNRDETELNRREYEIVSLTLGHESSALDPGQHLITLEYKKNGDEVDIWVYEGPENRIKNIDIYNPDDCIDTPDLLIDDLIYVLQEVKEKIE